MHKRVSDLAPTETAWRKVDPLGESLHFLQMCGVFYTRSEFTAPWGLALPALPDCLMFHVVTSGRCWLSVKDGAPQQLQPGNLVLVPHGEGHCLFSEPGLPLAKLFDLPREHVSERYEILRHGQGGAETTMVCGAVRFDHPAARQLIQLLPEVIQVDVWHSPQGEWLQSTLRLMAAEARELRPGGEAVITRLADILIIQAIRAWMAEDPQAQTGWLGALQDRQIGHAILLIHRQPARAWTVAALADEVAMSRSAFAARFRELVGEPPMHYLAWWRMQLAYSILKDEDLSLGELADRVGYQSEASFSRAFKRYIGASPGAVRQRPDDGWMIAKD